jgi:hypothetical protein
MKTLLLSLAALLSLACSGPAPYSEPEAGQVTHSHGSPAAELPEMPPVVSEPEPVDRLRAAWTLDEAFSEDEVWTIMAAGDVWNGATDGRVSLTFKVGPVGPEELWTVRRGPIEPGTPGRSSIRAEGARMVLDPDILPACPAALLTVAAHELGHTLGIYGHGVTGGVMTTGRPPGCDFALLPEDIEMFGAANP